MLSTVLGLLGTIVIFNVWYVLSYIIYLEIGLTFQKGDAPRHSTFSRL